MCADLQSPNRTSAVDEVGELAKFLSALSIRLSWGVSGPEPDNEGLDDVVSMYIGAQSPSLGRQLGDDSFKLGLHAVLLCHKLVQLFND